MGAVRQWGFFNHGRHGSRIRGHGRRLGKGSRNAYSTTILPLSGCDRFEHFSPRPDIAVTIGDPLPMAKSSNRSRWVFENRKHKKQLQNHVVGAFPRNAPARERANPLHSAHFIEMRPLESEVLQLPHNNGCRIAFGNRKERKDTQR